MSRDHRKLEVFHLADRLVLEIYTVTKALQFLSVAHGSAREAAYEQTLCARLGYLAESSTAPLANDYDHAAAMLLRIINGLR